MKKIAALFLVALVGGAVALGLFLMIQKEAPVYRDIPVTIPVRQANLPSSAPMNLPDFEAAADLTVHAVVHIRTKFQRKSLVYDDFFEFFNSRRGTPREQVFPYEAMGSGVIISPEGYIVTNNHVVQDANEITVTLNDRRVYNATIVGSDPSTDIALIRIEQNNLPFLSYGNSDDVRIGEWVLAVGNPFNLTSTVTAGIVSAKARNINILGSQGAIESFIQTDAAVNPGNSGGALVNTRGELIGINAAIASGTGYYQGYSFAIPVNIARKVVEDLMKYGKIQRAYFGIYYREIDDKMAKELGLESPKGIYIEDLVEGGSAAKGGIKKGDIILQLGNSEVNRKSELTEFMGQHNPGDNVAVRVWRDGQVEEMNIKLKSEDATQALVQDNKIIIHGATFEPLSETGKTRFGLDYGFQITQLNNGKLRDAGIREGFILLGIDRQPISSLSALKNALSGNSGGVLLEGLYPNGLKAYYGIGL
ncbi:MAG: Do family serine endopeptidase [Bacteroidales bacterium]|nr:Do family serine endopeptidase [Bacteroidales bacterium]